MIHRTFRIINIALILCLMLSLSAFSSEGSYAASKGKTKYIAHRGWSWRAPENTLPAFRLAAKNKGFYGVEFDVWEASYGKDEDPLLLVMHDQSLYNMCGISKDIRKITRSRLKKYRIRNGYNVNDYKWLRIPTVGRALNTIYDNSRGAVPVIELKHRLSKRALRYLLNYLDGREAVIISFDFDAVSDAVRMAEKMGISDSISSMYLMSYIYRSSYSSTIRKMKKAGIDCAAIKYPYVDRNTVRTFHRADLKVGVYTLLNKNTARAYASIGVDYITANGRVW